MSAQKSHSAAVLPAVGAEFVIEQRPTASPGPNEVLIKNHNIAMNPLDVSRQQFGFMIQSFPTIIGADISGTVVEVGSSVRQFKAGDRVFGHGDSFLSGNLDHSAYQEYIIIAESSVAHIPDTMNFREAATLSTAVGTAAMSLYDYLKQPLPTAVKPEPLSPSSPGILIWGGGSAVGSAAIQVARLSGFTVYTTASQRHHDRLRSYGAHFVADHSSPTVVEDLLAAIKRDGKEIPFSIDAISLPSTLPPVLEILTKSAGPAERTVITTLFWPEGLELPKNIKTDQVRSGGLWTRRTDLSAWLFNDRFPKWLENGSIKPQAQQVVPGGLAGLNKGIAELKNGVSAVKLMVEL